MGNWGFQKKRTNEQYFEEVLMKLDFINDALAKRNTRYAKILLIFYLRKSNMSLDDSSSDDYEFPLENSNIVNEGKLNTY
jgi:hypothetical protein